MHQQPPNTPLFASTSAANASQLDVSRALVVYAGTTTLLARRHPLRVAVVEHQRVAVGVGEERHVADPGVERVAHERHPALLQRLARGGHVLDVQCEVVRVGLELADKSEEHTSELQSRRDLVCRLLLEKKKKKQKKHKKNTIQLTHTTINH